LTTPPPDAPRAPRRLDDRLFVMCGLSWAAGLIHVAAAISHVEEYAPYALFFELLALAQFLWGMALYRAPSRKLLSAGAAMSVLVVALWILSRTSGLPIAPAPWRPEPVGPVDALASADEALLALLAVFPLRPGSPHAWLRACRHLALPTAVCLILMSSLALAGAGHSH
jgi:hypothetical protein